MQSQRKYRVATFCSVIYSGPLSPTEQLDPLPPALLALRLAGTGPRTGVMVASTRQHTEDTHRGLSSGCRHLRPRRLFPALSRCLGHIKARRRPGTLVIPGRIGPSTGVPVFS